MNGIKERHTGNFNDKITYNFKMGGGYMVVLFTTFFVNWKYFITRLLKGEKEF